MATIMKFIVNILIYVSTIVAMLTMLLIGSGYLILELIFTVIEKVINLKNKKSEN